MQKCLLVFLFIYPVLTYAQISINKTKAEIISDVLLFKKENPTIKVALEETDSTLIVTKTINRNKSSKQVLHLDSIGTCKWDNITFTYEDGIKKELESIFAITKYDWLKINENQYVSKFEEKLMVELPMAGESKSINIFRMDWNKLLYNLMLGN